MNIGIENRKRSRIDAQPKPNRCDYQQGERRSASNPPRWGDYSFAVPDGTSDSAWLATEYIPPESSQTTTGIRNWGTRVIKVPLG